ncbi:hypothetical protein COO60DRAFT_866861 [Scenedesmus sp. NREL 46B-D3]|nr:hypothetical protein COO60DRAFT_866861 [Scenedesmus sp. NREL 46B-D3]
MAANVCSFVSYMPRPASHCLTLLWQTVFVCLAFISCFLEQWCMSGAFLTPVSAYTDARLGFMLLLQQFCMSEAFLIAVTMPSEAFIQWQTQRRFDTMFGNCRSGTCCLVCHPAAAHHAVLHWAPPWKALAYSACKVLVLRQGPSWPSCFGCGVGLAVERHVCSSCCSRLAWPVDQLAGQGCVLHC